MYKKNILAQAIICTGFRILSNWIRTTYYTVNAFIVASSPVATKCLFILTLKPRFQGLNLIMYFDNRIQFLKTWHIFLWVSRGATCEPMEAETNIIGHFGALLQGHSYFTVAKTKLYIELKLSYVKVVLIINSQISVNITLYLPYGKQLVLR